MIKLAVVRLIRAVVEGGIGFHESNTRWQGRRKGRNTFEVVAHGRQQVTRGGKIEKRRVFLEIRRCPNVLEIASIGACI